MACRTVLISGLLSVWTFAGYTPIAAAQQDDPPPTTLPFEPTVPSAPPTRPTYPEPARPAAPPIDPLCLEIGPIIRAGVVASRFATLSPETAAGGPIGTFPTGEAIAGLGPAYCTVVIPAASPATADSPFNQVTCQIDQQQSESASLDNFRDRQTALAEQIAACPAMSRWEGTVPMEATASAGAAVEDYVFSHADVPVQLVIRASARTKMGDWPMSKMRTLSLIFRTPNPNRPPPVEQADIEAPRRE